MCRPQPEAETHRVLSGTGPVCAFNDSLAKAGAWAHASEPPRSTIRSVCGRDVLLLPLSGRNAEKRIPHRAYSHSSADGAVHVLGPSAQRSSGSPARRIQVRRGARGAPLARQFRAHDPDNELQAVVTPRISAANEALQRRARNSASCRVLPRSWAAPRQTLPSR